MIKYITDLILHISIDAQNQLHFVSKVVVNVRPFKITSLKSFYSFVNKQYLPTFIFRHYFKVIFSVYIHIFTVIDECASYSQYLTKPNFFTFIDLILIKHALCTATSAHRHTSEFLLPTSCNLASFTCDLP